MSAFSQLLAIGTCFVLLAPPAFAAPRELRSFDTSISARDARYQEMTIASNPTDFVARSKLAAYYALNFVARDRRYPHVLWIIEHRPESAIAGSHHVSLDPQLDRPAYGQARRLWLRHSGRHPADRRILYNAARFFRSDPQLANRMFDQIDELDVVEAVGQGYESRSKLRSSGRFAEAVMIYGREYEARRRIMGEFHPRTLRARFYTGELHSLLGNFELAGTHLQGFIGSCRREELVSAPFDVALIHLAKVRLNQSQLEEAESLCRECLTIRETSQRDRWTLFNTRSLLGEILVRQRKFAAAEPLLIEGFEGMQERQQTIGDVFRSDRLRDGLRRLVALYEAWDKPDQASKWRGKLQGRLELSSPAQP